MPNRRGDPVSSGPPERLNDKKKARARRACGHRNTRVFKLPVMAVRAVIEVDPYGLRPFDAS
jgi:hypothetical protein